MGTSVRRWSRFRSLALLWTVTLAAACAPKTEGDLPTAEEVVEAYSYPGRLEAEILGNVAHLQVTQSADQLRRGGSLWAKVGPYIFLFSEETQGLFQQYGGLAGVRVTTYVRGTEVASALLAHAELSDILWRRSLNISGKARLEGTQRMTRLEDLVDWGESHTEFNYNESFTNR